MAAKTRWTPLNWQDPFELDSQLSEEQRMVRDSAQQYAQSALAPRVKEAYRQESTDPNIFREMGEMGLSGRHDRRLRLPRCRLRLLRRDRTRDRARGLRLSLDDERAILSGDVPHLRLRHRGAAREIPP